MMKMRQVTNKKTKEMIRVSNAKRLLKLTQQNLYRSNFEKKMKKIYMKSKLFDLRTVNMIDGSCTLNQTLELLLMASHLFY